MTIVPGPFRDATDAKVVAVVFEEFLKAGAGDIGKFLNL
jgi:hypothetical protein